MFTLLLQAADAGAKPPPQHGERGTTLIYIRSGDRLSKSGKKVY
jgi:hypothetical protein